MDVYSIPNITIYASNISFYNIQYISYIDEKLRNGQHISGDSFPYIQICRCPVPLKLFLKIGNKRRRFYERLLCDITLSWYYTIRRKYTNME